MQDDRRCNLYFIVWLWDFTPGFLRPSLHLLHHCCMVSFAHSVHVSRWILADFLDKKPLTTGYSGSLTQLRCDSCWSQKSGSGSFPETGCSLLPDFSVNYSFFFWIELILQFFWLWLYSECSRKITFHHSKPSCFQQTKRLNDGGRQERY